jgi:acetylornithine deacetylase/succinyl-diaminopimelate desuccinylase-like protein
MIARGVMQNPILASLDPDRVIALTQAMVRVPSFTKEEKDVADWAANTMRAMGFDDVWEHEVTPGRANVIGRLQGSGEAPSILLRHIPQYGEG